MVRRGDLKRATLSEMAAELRDRICLDETCLACGGSGLKWPKAGDGSTCPCCDGWGCAPVTGWMLELEEIAEKLEELDS